VTELVNGSVPPPDGVDETLKKWIQQDNGAHAMMLTQLRREILGLNKRGSWTPSITFDVPGNLTLSVTGAWGEYRRAARYMELWGTWLGRPTFTTASGNLRITGLPIAISGVDTNFVAYGDSAWTGITKAGYTQIVVRAVAGRTYLDTFCNGSGQAAANVTTADLVSGAAFFMGFHVVYRF
jgi:hypothetical protein